MKNRKILIVAFAAVLLCSFVSIAYADNYEHPWTKNWKLWRLFNDINQNKMDILALEEDVAEINDRLEKIEEDIAAIMAMLQPSETPFIGTWANPENNGTMVDPTVDGFPGKMIIAGQQDGTYSGEWYINHDDTAPLGIGTMTPFEEWYDLEDNFFLQADTFDGTDFIFFLYRISPENDYYYMEIMIDYSYYPSMIDPTSERYFEMFRQ